MVRIINNKEIDRILVFNGIKEDSRGLLKECSNMIELKKDETLFLEKDEIKKFYAIVEGKVTICRYSEWGQKRIFFILGRGEFINEVILDNLPAAVVCEAFEDSKIVGFNKSEFLDIMEEDFILTQNVINSIGKKLRRLYRQVKNTVPIKIDKKVAAKLWKLSRDYGVESGEWTTINLKITVTYLSNMLGSSRETVSRALKKLQDEEIVRWENKKIMTKKENLLKYYRNV